MASAQLTRAREFLVLHDSDTHTRHDVLLPDTDIDAHIEFSYARSVFYLIGILLVLTDIPRTGLSTDVKRVYGIVAPSTSMYYGPFEYHMAHLVRDERDDGLRVLNGSCDGSPIDSMEVWSYKFDTLSIPPRAMAQHLSLTSFPRCLLYKQHCPTSTLPTSTASLQEENRWLQQQLAVSERSVLELVASHGQLRAHIQSLDTALRQEKKRSRESQRQRESEYERHVGSLMRIIAHHEERALQLERELNEIRCLPHFDRAVVMDAAVQTDAVSTTSTASNTESDHESAITTEDVPSDGDDRIRQHYAALTMEKLLYRLKLSNGSPAPLPNRSQDSEDESLAPTAARSFRESIVRRLQQNDWQPRHYDLDACDDDSDHDSDETPRRAKRETIPSRFTPSTGATLSPIYESAFESEDGTQTLSFTSLSPTAA